MTSSGTTGESGHAPKPFDPSRSSDDRRGVGLGRQVLDAVGLHAVLAVLRLEAAVERGDDVLHHLGRRAAPGPGPCSPLALMGSTVPASMWSAIWRGSQSVT